MRLRLLVLAGLVMVGAGWGIDWNEDAAIRESLAIKGSLLGQRWLAKIGRRDYLLRQSRKPTADSGLRCVGRWSYGPSLKVSVRVTADDTVICLTRGSGASLVRLRSQKGVRLELLGDVNFDGLPRRAVLSDTLVVAGISFGSSGIEVHGVSNPASPNRLSRIDLPTVNDIAVNGTLVYAACADDTLRIYSIADPRNPVRVGACRDSCDLYLSYADGYCYLVHVSGVNIVDVRNPTQPRRVGRITGGEPLAVMARDTLCYVTVYESGLRIYSIASPTAPRLLGSLNGPDAMDVTMAPGTDNLLYTSWLDIINVASPASPFLVGRLPRPANGVAVLPARNKALLAVDGLTVVDITEPAAPRADTNAYSAGSALDIALDDTKAYLGSYHSGLAILDVSRPEQPCQLGGLDYIGALPSCLSVAARDSFAFVSWDSVPQLRSVDVTDPYHPVQAGGCDVWDRPADMVLRDTLLYCAMPRRFQIVNVARPRQPVLIGSCAGDGVAVVVQDSFAYTAAGAIRITNIARPDSPFVVSTISGHNATGIAVRDTFLYLPYVYDTIFVYSIANPAQPRLLSTVQSLVWPTDIVLGDARAYVGGAYNIDVYDLSRPELPRRIGRVGLPSSGLRRLCYADGLLYAALWDAGVAIYETTAVAVAEPTWPKVGNTSLKLTPNPTKGPLRVRLPASGSGRITVRDVIGRSVTETVSTASGHECWVDISGQPDGVYLVETVCNGTRCFAKIVKD